MVINFQATMTEADFKRPLLDAAEARLALEARGLAGAEAARVVAEVAAEAEPAASSPTSGKATRSSAICSR